MANPVFSIAQFAHAPSKTMNTLPRRIAHLDMDAFYASVELLRYPQLKGLPVVIGGRWRELAEKLAKKPLDKIPLEDFPRIREYVGRGVITTATYAARQFGVGSAMGMMKAAQLCPDAIMLPVDFDEYRKYSRLFKAEILKLAPVMENRGVDEVFIDFTDVAEGQEQGGYVLAEKLQKNIFERTGLTCSIGVAPNKLLAKMASEFNKPNGIAIIYERDLENKIWPLSCRKINGIGPRTDEKLKALGIHTIGELAVCDQSFLQARFGMSYGAWLYRASHGEDNRPVETASEPVSMSRETTFSRDLHAVHDKKLLGEIFTELCEQVSDDLTRKGYAGRTVGIKIRYDNFKSATRDHSETYYLNDAATIRALAGQCLKRVPLDRRLRLLGVKVSNLSRKDYKGRYPDVATHTASVARESRNLSLFDDEQELDGA